MKTVFTIEFHPPMDQPRPWAFTISVEEYRQGKQYGGAVVYKHTMRKGADYKTTLRKVKSDLRKTVKWALT